MARHLVPAILVPKCQNPEFSQLEACGDQKKLPEHPCSGSQLPMKTPLANALRHLELGASDKFVAHVERLERSACFFKKYFLLCQPVGILSRAFTNLVVNRVLREKTCVLGESG
jgi:hypothetical protein